MIIGRIFKATKIACGDALDVDAGLRDAFLAVDDEPIHLR
jgi:hypothetical protein